jgi:hypothetical protein
MIETPTVKYQQALARLETRKANKTAGNIQVPIVKKLDTGLSRRTYVWSLIFYVDGKQKMKSTNTKNVAEARKIRNAFYKQLLAAGATVKPSHGRTTK